MTGHLPPSPSADLLSAAVSKLSALNVRMDSLEQHVNSRLDVRDQVVAAVADVIARLTARMDSYEAREPTSEPPGDDAIDYPVGQLAEGPEAQRDDGFRLPPSPVPGADPRTVIGERFDDQEFGPEEFMSPGVEPRPSTIPTPVGLEE